MVKLRSQDDDPKGKGVDTEESEPQWFSRFHEATEQRFSKFQETNDRRLSQLEAMFAEMCASRKQTNQMSDDQSTIDRSSTPSRKARGSGSDHFERSGDDRRFGGGQYRDGGHQSYGNLTRLAKIEFPRFDGNNLKGWVFKAEQFFGNDKTPPELKVQMASVHFVDFASEWHQNFIRSEVGMSVVHDWKSYVQFLREMFECWRH